MPVVVTPRKKTPSYDVSPRRYAFSIRGMGGSDAMVLLEKSGSRQPMIVMTGPAFHRKMDIDII
jgi:hypothetical protein